MMPELVNTFLYLFIYLLYKPISEIYIFFFNDKICYAANTNVLKNQLIIFDIIYFFFLTFINRKCLLFDVTRHKIYLLYVLCSKVIH